MKVRVAGPLTLRALGLVIPALREVAVVLYQWQEPWISDWSAFEAAFGPFERTPLDEAIATTLEWWRGELAARGRASVAPATAA